MNKITRGLAIAGVAGATLLGGISLSTGISSAQQDPATQSSAPATGAAPADAPSPGQCPDGPMRHRGLNLDVAASAIGIDVDALHAALRDGSTLAQVAQAHNVDPQAVIDALVADVQQHLADQVSSGELAQAQADEHLADATTHITDLVNNGRPERPDGPPPGRPERPADGDAGTSSSSS